MNKTLRFFPFYFCLFTFAFCLSAVSQTLTVREIMREPSITGMRPESEKLSPDGKLVVFAWNADGKEPRNLYLISSSGGQAQMIVDAEKNFESRTESPANKLNYGLIVRDDFVKALCDLATGHAQNAAVQENVLTASQFVMKTCAYFQ